MSSGERRKEFISVRPTPGREKTNVSKTVAKVPKILTSLQKENVGQSLVSMCRWSVKVKVIIVEITVMGGVLLAQGSPHCLDWWTGLGSHERMLCPQGFLPELIENLESTP